MKVVFPEPRKPLDKWYQIGNVITILDARLEEKLQPQAEYILASEAADAGCIVLSKSQEASGEEISGTVKHLNRALESVKCKRRFTENEILTKNWENFTEEDFQYKAGLEPVADRFEVTGSAMFFAKFFHGKNADSFLFVLPFF